MAHPSLSRMLKSKLMTERFEHSQKELEHLQLQILRIQQGVWHQRSRVIIVFEGFDAAGKGGAIRRLVERLDPRGLQVHPIGPPKHTEQAKHYLYRFWKKLPEPGTIAIFDRSWYGRVLVERVEGLVEPARWKQAFAEIVEFERQLTQDGIILIKLFLAIDKKEQLKRFEERLSDPYKNWKLTMADVEARAKWKNYVQAVDEMLRKTNRCKWHLIAANDKNYARRQTLQIVVNQLQQQGRWMESKAQTQHVRTLQAALRDLGVQKSSI